MTEASVQLNLKNIIIIETKMNSILIKRIPILCCKKYNILSNNYTYLKKNRIVSELQFDNTEETFKFKTTMELFRSWFIFRLCGNKLLVKNSGVIVDLSEKVLGKKIMSFIMKQTFFGHFCAGEDSESTKLTIKKLRDIGVGTILDYAIEGNKSFYDEQVYDTNMVNNLSCIKNTGKGGFSAIKFTSLCKSELLIRISEILVESKNIFMTFAHADNNYITLENFKQLLQNFYSHDKITEMFNIINTSGNGYIDYIEWVNHLNPDNLSLGILTQYRNELNNLEQHMYKSMLKRIDILAQSASNKGVYLLVDAEQSYFQPAIDYLVTHLQRKFNKEQPVVFNTIQCYMKGSNEHAVVELERAKREGFKYGVKVVRGAYLLMEREIAFKKGCESPVHNTIKETHDNYNHIMYMMLLNNSICDVLIASHNEESIKKAVSYMSSLGINRNGNGVYFGQLFGMSDHVSFALGREGYGVYKYIPYGPVQEVIPYLIRRVEENADIMNGSKKDLQMIQIEITRRFKF